MDLIRCSKRKTNRSLTRMISHPVVSHSVTPQTTAHQAPLSVEFFRQEYWSGLPFLSPGDLLDPGIYPVSPAFPALAGGFFYHCATRKAWDRSLARVYNTGSRQKFVKTVFTNNYTPWKSSLVAQRLKRLPLMRETWVQSLGQEDPLEKEMTTHPSILAWRIPWMDEPGGLQSTGSQRVGHD